MKNKIFFTIFAAVMLFSVFALAVSATEITYSADFGEVKSVDGMNTIEGISTDARVVLKNADGTYTTYPTYYIMKNSKTFGTDYTNLNANTSESYTDASMILIEIPDGVTGISGNLFGMDSTNHPTTSLEKIVILSDDYTKIAEQTFRRMPTVKSVTISASVTEIYSWAFCGSTALQEVIFEEGSLLEKTGKSFADCTALSSINLEACTKLKTLGDSIFNGCTSLKKIALPDSIETIGSQAFYRYGELELASDYLPKNLKTIGTHFLSRCTVVNDVLYFPEGFTEMSASYHFNDGFTPKTQMTLVFLGKMTDVNLSNVALTFFNNYCSKQPLNLIFAKNSYSDLSGDFVQCVDYNGTQGYISKHADGSAPYTSKTGTLTVRLCNNDPNSGSSLGTDANGNTVCKAQGAPAKLIFCGGSTVEYSYSVRNNHTDKGWYRFHTTSWTYDIDAHKAADEHYNSCVIQEGNCGYDETTTTTCVICKLQSVITGTLATGEHTYTDDFNCETALDCEVCKKTLAEALVHNMVVSVIYENGYASVGSKVTACDNEGCKHSEAEELKALFACLGFSSSNYGSCGFIIGFSVDNEAVSVYTELTGKTVKYGVFAASKKNLGENDIINQDGSVNNGIIKAEIKKLDFAYFDLKIIGFADGQKDAKLAFGAYVEVIDGDIAEYSYIQSGTPSEGEKYYFASYNDIINPAE